MHQTSSSSSRELVGYTCRLRRVHVTECNYTSGNTPPGKQKQNMKRYFMEGDGKELSTKKDSKDMKKHSPEKKGSKPFGEKNIQIDDDVTNKKDGYPYRSREKKLQFAARQAARTEILLHEEAGFLEADEGEDTTSITQHDLAGVVDITSAQKSRVAAPGDNWTYMYDNQGIELHCLKKLDCVLRMEFLPFHFLLASAVWETFSL
ncbi:hypothetical protein DPMN_152266 [Dreissena polymorpha]|uniref:Uncharacterized protein n=1 Tax=Dreissena polymorpha TaxID=45954 RepID=A0A9D4J781_DREPO|nr:hypothetical protein DPMN_152266 [Dreissena polymorpha]